MTKHILSAMAVLTLLGCGVPAYFDQHPSNVRAASDIDPDEDAFPPEKTAEASATSAPLPTAVVALPAPMQQPTAPRIASPTSTARTTLPADRVASAPPAVPKIHVAAPVAGTIESTPAVPAPSAPEATPTPVESPPAIPAPQAVYAPAVTPMPMSAPLPGPPSTVQTAPIPIEDVVSTQSAPQPRAAPERIAVRASPPVMESAPVSVPIAQASEPPPMQMSPPLPSRDARCEAVATARAEDAAANGKDDDLQRAVHDGTYADCVAWANAHPGGN